MTSYPSLSPSLRSIAVLLGLLATPVHGQTPDPAEAQSPQDANRTRIEFGYQKSLLKSGTDQLYYNLTYKGNVLSQKNQPFSFSSVDQPVQTPDTKDPGGDTNAFSVRLERGSVTSLSPLLDTLNVQPLHLNLPGFFSTLRGAAQFSGQLNGDQLNLAVGLETPPWHPVSQQLHIPWPNWLVVGIQGEAQSRRQTTSGSTAATTTEQNQSRDVGMLTYRFYVGKGFHWVASANQQDLLAHLKDRVLQVAHTYSEGAALVPDILARAGKGKASPVDLVILGLAGGAHYAGDPNHNPPIPPIKGTPQETNPTLWLKDVTDAVAAYTITKDQPSMTAQLESSGWYTFSGHNGPRDVNAVVAVGATYYLNPTKDATSYLQVRYENGFRRAAPDTRQHFFGLIFGYTFQ